MTKSQTMQDGYRLYQMISIIERQHGLATLDVSSRFVLDLIVTRELNGEQTTARDLIEVSGMARAVVYRKLTGLKKNNWIKEEWRNFKLCYRTASCFETMARSFKDQLA